MFHKKQNTSKNSKNYLEKIATSKSGPGKLAFTLVELIVVITILAILGTIAFISLSGYSSQSRDSVRISDLASMKLSLDLFKVDAGKYPQTTDGTNITYSGATAWIQGYFGDPTAKNIGKLDKIPTDPLTNQQYVYSTTFSRNEFQLAAIMEGDNVTYNSSVVNAATNTALIRITGTYNGRILKVSTGTIDCVIASPSIITSSGTTLESITINNLLSYNGYKNIPFQYSGNYQTTGETALNLVNSTKLEVYCGDLKILSDSTSTGQTARATLLTKLQDAYSGTTINTVGEIVQILNASGSTDIENLTTSIIRNNLGGKIIAGTTLKTVADCTTSTGVIYGTTDGTDTGLTCTNDIIICNGTTGSGMILSSCNLGATTVRDGTTNTFTSASCTSSLDCSNKPSWFGDYYQWGRNEPLTGNFISNTYNGVLINGNIGNNDMYKGDDTYSDWWQNEAGYTEVNTTRWTGINPQGPCPVDWHIPSTSEWQLLCNISLGITCGSIVTYNPLLITKLKLPLSGQRDYLTGYYSNQSSGAVYWSSVPVNTRSKSFVNAMSSNRYYPTRNGSRATGSSIRCVKN